MINETPYIGRAMSRVDGHAKVTGEAKYAAEYFVPGMLYGCIVNSTITKGKIKHINTSEALALKGVAAVLTHENRPDTAWLDLKYSDMDAPPGKPFRPLHDDKILFNGQPIALVIADTFEQAAYAASLLKIDYEAETHETSLEENLGEARKPKKGLSTFMKPGPPKPKGNFDKAYKKAPNKMSGEYQHSIEHHNPMEMFASTVHYESDEKLTIYDKTQGAINSQMYVANVFGLKYKNVRIISPFVGGAFGSGLRPQYQLFLAVMASLHLKKSVRVVMNRHQMFTFGHRPATMQYVQYATDEAGKMEAMFHKSISETSSFEDYTETIVSWGNMMYPCKNVKPEQQLVALDVSTPLDMRAPGGSTGMHPIECAIDELAYQLKKDPIEFRLINYSDVDDSSGKPYSSKELKECFKQGAEKIGWHTRSPEPRSVKRGNNFVGMGMATGMWEASQLPARAEAILTPDGKLNVCSATADIGTGTYTVMAQIAADLMGMNMDDVTFSLGDSDMPFAPIEGGSFTVATVGTAVQKACEGLQKKLIKSAKKIKSSPFANLEEDEITFAGGAIRSKKNAADLISFADLITHNKGEEIKSKNMGLPFVKRGRKYTKTAHSAVFAEVEVDEDFGVIKVTKLVSAVAAGKIINPKTARSQILGGMVWGISKALHEETKPDHRFGRFMNANLAEYHISVQADVPPMDVIFVEEHDRIVNDLGVKGLGEIGLVGVAPAIANAVFNATGKRINSLPLTLDKLM